MNRKHIFVLVTDDDEDDRYFLRKAFERAIKEISVLEARDGTEAINLLAERPVHLIVLDMNMPGLNGLETLAFIRLNTNLCHTPAVMISTSDQPVLVADAYKKGFNCYIKKPVLMGDYDQIAQALKTCFLL
ncbi:response regulator [Larkinella insperata]|uniref:Response regulator n=1 Tax=Larkinella insperata TaxID=332158 RepID=A0ABW3Q2Q5_9BACT